jgi:hypothetical protein
MKMRIIVVLALAASLQACSDEATETSGMKNNTAPPAAPAAQESMPEAYPEQASTLTSPFDSTDDSASGSTMSQQEHAHDGNMTSSSNQDTPYQTEAAAATDTYSTNTSSASENPPMQVYGTVGNLTWEPARTATQYDNIQLKVSGPEGTAINETFGAGEAAMITESLPDGYYKWETVTTPSIPAHIRQEMQEVRNSGDPKAEQALLKRLQNEGYMPTREQARNNVQSGGFRIVDGQVVTGGEPER